MDTKEFSFSAVYKSNLIVVTFSYHWCYLATVCHKEHHEVLVLHINSYMSPLNLSFSLEDLKSTISARLLVLMTPTTPYLETFLLRAKLVFCVITEHSVNNFFKFLGGKHLFSCLRDANVVYVVITSMSKTSFQPVTVPTRLLTL